VRLDLKERSALVKTALLVTALSLAGFLIVAVGMSRSQELDTGYGLLGMLTLSLYAQLLGLLLWTIVLVRAACRRLRARGRR
jgi:hypothetical protein